MKPLVVVAPAATAPGFALAGAQARATDDAGAVEGHVEAALSAGAVVVAIHPELWRRVPAATRTRWQQRTDKLILSLPPDDGVPTADREAELHELLARAVGYEISFSPGGTS